MSQLGDAEDIRHDGIMRENHAGEYLRQVRTSVVRHG